ncbi:unnamed protein product [Hydatigera taeniaeformis]|uniref:UPF0506 domain-containing protein n=1 Tax=Hydatigena taeniaeformis TaxID=6205 RepID=A0A0R3WIP7_HYDTA|nr:unnamed protein product [Hydatigera taeniaeformis]
MLSRLTTSDSSSLICLLFKDSCKRMGERCDRTVFNRCCEGLYCVLKGFADGSCEKCLPQGHFCFSDAECCSDCRREGEDCSRTIFSRCCDPLFCQLHSFAQGKCVKCLAGRQFCMSDSECCSGKCHWYRICSDS